MSRSAALRACDVRAVFHLVGECRELGDDPVAWRQHLLAGAARLTGADAARYYEGRWEPGGLTGVVNWGFENGFDRQIVDLMDAEFPRQGFNFSPMFQPFMAALRQGLGPSLTRADLLRDTEWYRSSFYRIYHAPSGADVMMYSTLPLPGGGGQLSGRTLIRAIGQPDFTPRARVIDRELHAAITALVGGPLARLDEPSPADLPPRLRQVLRCLLEGDADKQVAARLGLTRHTVNQYIKVIFRHFGVGSRAELLARWVRRGWGGRCAWAD
jgi:DNA-binding CsgD family transcriptional regulator